ncbi:uncharacterized protein [Pocillopora verrucosa]|uniref:uncharacterized protein isoform X2 n=1 Tax=Pocillopora verrucosa TaxID=203993 RepID=UPI00334123A2
MPPKRDFRSKKSLNVVTFKGGKAIRKSKFSVPVRYAAQQLTDTTSVVAGSSLNTCGGFSPDQEDLPHIDEYHGLRTNQRSKSKKVRLKRKLKAYHERKATLALSWLNAREQLVSALLTRQALPLGQMCVIPFCEEEACGRCLHCSPGQFLCADHINLVHAGGRSLHHPEVWKDGRFVPYQFGECVWTTPHNMDHGYVRDIIAVGLHGQQNPIKIKCCEHEPEAITLVRNGFWPFTPKQPQVAFDLEFMALLQYIFLECRVSLRSICQALQWLVPPASKVYIKDIYWLLVGDCFCEFRYMSSMLSNLKHFNPSYENDHECPACPKEKGSLFISVDALFGCVRKCSAGTSGKSSNHGEELFISQEKVDAFLANYSKRPSRAV